MIYALFIGSFVAYLTLQTILSYYQFFNVQAGATKENEKPKKSRFAFFRIHKLIAAMLFNAEKDKWIEVTKGTEKKLSIIRGIGHFLGIFCCVAFVFSVLQFWLDRTTDVEFAQATILQLEQAQFKIKEFAGRFKIGFIYEIIIIVLLIALAGSLPVFEQYKLKDKFKKYSKVVKNILYVLSISTSFTFFGNRFSAEEEGRIGKLEMHRLRIIENNKLLLKQINEEVTGKVINEILTNPKVEAALDKVEEAKANVETAALSDNYREYAAAAPDSAVKLSVSVFSRSFNRKYNFEEALAFTEDRFQEAYKQTSANAQPDYYAAKEERKYTEFKESNSQWFDEKNVSENSVKQTEASFAKAGEATETKFSKYYQKYKEPIDKLIKKGYKNTGAKWVKDVFEMIGADLPFISEFIDPIINEPIEDFITKKSEKILKYAFEGKPQSAEAELKSCSPEFKTAFAGSVNSSEKFARLESRIQADLLSSRDITTLTENELRREFTKAENHLRKICSESRWELIRKDFRQRLRGGERFGDFTQEQLDNFDRVLKNWEDYKMQHKLSWYSNNVNDIEKVFFNYSKNDGELKACWGFILQQQDWDGASRYYSLHPEPGASGKPYYLLKYYYHSTGNGWDAERLYDDATQRGVGLMCPPH